MEMSLRRPLIFGSSLIVAITVLYLVGWNFMAREVVKGFGSWVEAQRTEGLTMSHGPVAISGFPGNFVLTVERPAVGRVESTTPWEWRGPTAKIIISPFRLDRMVIEAPGIHDFSISDPEAALSHYSLNGPTIALELIGGPDGQTSQFSLLAENSEFRDSLGRRWRAERALLKANRLKPADPSALKSPSWLIDGEGRGVDLPDALNPPLGARIAGLASKMAVMGPIEGGEGAREILSKWTEAGGLIEVESLELSWTPLRLRVKGTLALDRELQPLGAFTANAEGYAETVDALAERGIVAPSDVMAAKLVLAALAKHPNDGGAPIITMPLTIQDRVLGIGPARLIKLPEIIWK
jgi:hypothetical protein